jgi:hypothetical protein
MVSVLCVRHKIYIFITGERFENSSEDYFWILMIVNASKNTI